MSKIDRQFVVVVLNIAAKLRDKIFTLSVVLDLHFKNEVVLKNASFFFKAFVHLTF